MPTQRDIISAHLEDEQGTLFGHGSRAVAMVYPSPYNVAMASLGFQTVYRLLNSLHDTVAERSFLPTSDCSDPTPLLTYESQRPVSDFPVIAFSVAYEIELAGFFECLEKMGLAPLSAERKSRDPLIIAGGPLTFSNPVPLGPFADVIVMGEAEDVLPPLMDTIFDSHSSREQLLEKLAAIDGLYIPSVHGEVLLPVSKASDESLPGYGAIITPHCALPNMFLIEPERGCSRGCSFCVMRRTTNGGMRKVEPEKLMALIPENAKRVGLVGAAVSDHPKIGEIVSSLVESGRGVGLSSLRADRLTPQFVQDLQKGGYKTLTVASDGASERLRKGLEKRIREKHLLRAAELCAEFNVPQLKLYMMLGVLDESDDDLQELVDFSLKQVALLKGRRTQMALGIAPFVAKRNTPLDGQPFIGVREVDRRVKLLRKGLGQKVELRSVSARWAWVEYVLAQGGFDAGLAYYTGYKAGGKFADYKRAFADADMGAPNSPATPGPMAVSKPGLSIVE